MRDLVHDGDTVALEGFTHLIPNAAGHELIRQGVRDLTLVRMTPDVVYDQLIGMGCARKLVFSGAATRASARCTGCATRSSTAGRGRSSSRSTRTRGWRRPTRPARRTSRSACCAGYGGTDLAARTRGSRRSPARSPARSSPPCRRSGPTSGSSTRSRPTGDGNVQLWGITGVQKEAVLASSRSIVTVEEIVDELELRPGGVVLPAWVIDAVAERARRRTPVVRARLLRPRQRLLRRVGRDQPRPRHASLEPGCAEHVPQAGSAA